MQTTTMFVIPGLGGAISRTRGFMLCLIWVAFPVLSNGDLAVGVIQGEVFMRWRLNTMDISTLRFVFNPNDTAVIEFKPKQVIGNATDDYINRVSDIGNVSLGTVSFRLLGLTVGDAGRYFYKSVSGTDAGGQVLVIARAPVNVSVRGVSEPIENEKYTMQCSAEPTSVQPGMGLNMHYHWKRKNGQNITVSDRYSFSPDQSNLTINPLKRQDAADSFVCVAWEYVGAVSQSGPFTLTVFYGPDTNGLTLSPSNTSYQLTELSSHTVQCSATCVPQCNYQWIGPGISQNDNKGLFSISQILRNQTGTFNCTVTNPRIPGKSATANFSVIVYYGPDAPLTLDPVTTDYRKTEGTFIPNITCSASCNPPCSYQWIGPLSATSSGVLSLGTLDRLQQGSYFCTATNSRTSTFVNGSTVHMAVIYGPDVPHLSPNTTVYTKLEGETVPDINCSADCFPGCTQVWMKGLTAVQESSNGTLALRQVYRDKAGYYTCWFNNTESKAAGYISITLVVQYPPVLAMKATNTSKGGRVIINCTASGVPDNYTFFKWTHKAPDESRTIVRELEVTRIPDSMVSFTIEDATYQDSGFYICKVSNGITNNSTGKLIMEDMVYVWITDQPKITVNGRNFDAEKGKSGHMHIEFYSGLFQPIVTWYRVKNGTMELLQNSGDFGIFLSAVTVELQYHQKTVQLPGYKAGLDVFDVKMEHFTSYKVEINSSFGEPVSKILELNPRGPPETPANFSVVPNSVTTHSLQLIWQAGFHGGANQTFVIEYRETGETNWINKSEPRGLVQYVTLNTAITDLKEGTTYEFRIYSENIFNRSKISPTVNETTKTVMKHKPENPDGSSVIIGAAMGSVLVLVTAVAVVGFIFYKRRQTIKSPKEDMDVFQEEKSLRSMGGMQETWSDRRECGLVDNPVYDSSGQLPDPCTSGGAAGVEYAAVVKPKKTAGQVEDPSNLYAQVDKTNKKWKKGQVKEKHGKAPKGDIYENATLVGRDTNKGNMYANSGDLKGDENLYEKPSKEAPKGSLANKDGLMYADLMLDPPITKNGKYVIRGLENRTEYAEIAYGKRGYPLPDDD